MATVLIALKVNDDDIVTAYNEPYVGANNPANWDDLILSLEARLEEFFCGKDNYAVRGDLIAVADFTGVLDDLLNAAEVGVDGIDDADDRGHVQGSLIEFRLQAETKSY